MARTRLRRASKRPTRFRRSRSPAANPQVACVNCEPPALSRSPPQIGDQRAPDAHPRTRQRPPAKNREPRREQRHAPQPRVMPQKDRSPNRLSPFGASFTFGSLPMRQREYGSPRGSLRRSTPDEGAGASGGSRRGPGDRGLPRAPRVNRRWGREPRRCDEAGLRERMGQYGSSYEPAGTGKKPYRPTELFEKWTWLQDACTSAGGATFSKTTTWPSALDEQRFR